MDEKLRNAAVDLHTSLPISFSIHYYYNVNVTHLALSLPSVECGKHDFNERQTLPLYSIDGLGCDLIFKTTYYDDDFIEFY